MSSVFGSGYRFCGVRSRRPIVALGLAVLLSACSADVSRFDFPASVSLNDTTTGTIPAPTEPSQDRANLGAEPSSGQAYFPPRQDTPNDVRMSALPEPSQAARPEANYTPPAASPAPPAQAWPVEQRDQPNTAAQPAPAVPAYEAAAAPDAKGEMIEVRPGDTLYGLSRRHRVALSELMSVNDLKGPNLKPGQKLYLPAASGQKTNPAAASVPPPAIVAADAPADWTGSYVVRQGDSLYAVARRFNVKQADLQKYNGIHDVRRVKPGTVLRMPANAGAQLAEAPAVQSDAPPASHSVTVTSPEAPAPAATGAGVPAQPTILNSNQAPAQPAPTQTVAVNTPSSATMPAGSAAEVGKLRWPVQGKVISGFGQRPDGTHNDGVNVAVPMGTEVHAAEGGVVAYAGNELKGYGNLILLRHDNGWVTAYAHSEEILVKRGDRVKRGQVIAKAGKTGQVDQPQVHFELRQGQRPVDPTPYMEKL